MVEVKFIDGDKSVEAKGKAVFAVVIAPEGSEACSEGVSMGRGSILDIFSQTAHVLGATLAQMVKDPISRGVVVKNMLDEFTCAVQGDDEIKVVREEIEYDNK